MNNDKMPVVFLCALLLTVLLSGCAGRGQPVEGYDYSGYLDHTEDGLGLTLKLPSKYYDDRNDKALVPGKYEVMFGDISLLGQDLPKAETDPSDHLDLFFMPLKGEYCLLRILAYPAGKWDEWMSSGKAAADITGNANAEEILRKDGTVYVYDQPAIDTAAFDGEMTAAHDEIMQMLPAIKASIRPVSFAMDDLGVFSTVDLNGRPVDNSIFAGHRLTMINIWATFCQPCIKELPDLQRMSQAMPEGTQLISIVGDVDSADSLELAQTIAGDKGVSFPSIVPDSSLREYLDNNMVAFPTTLFVDSQGRIVGEPIIGERDRSVYLEVLNDRLDQVDSQSR